MFLHRELPDNLVRFYAIPVPEPTKANRGPSAGPENRRALIAAARAVFAESGYSAPLSAVARRAGVGQGSLYRHFPDRVALADLDRYEGSEYRRIRVVATRDDGTQAACWTNAWAADEGPLQPLPGGWTE